MNKFKIALGFYFLFVSFNTNASTIVSVQKSELTGKAEYRYMNIAAKGSGSLQIDCSPSGKLFLRYCTPGRYSFSANNCTASFHHKFDNEKLEKFDGISASYSADTPVREFIKKMVAHQKVVLATFPDLPSMPVNTFNIRDAKQKLSEFNGQCGDLGGQPEQKPSEKKPAAAANNDDPNQHWHGSRSHAHPFPALNHRHGGGEPGSKQSN